MQNKIHQGVLLPLTFLVVLTASTALTPYTACGQSDNRQRQAIAATQQPGFRGHSQRSNQANQQGYRDNGRGIGVRELPRGAAQNISSDSGILIVNGQYIPGPHLLRIDNEQVLVNDIELDYSRYSTDGEVLTPGSVRSFFSDLDFVLDDDGLLIIFDTNESIALSADMQLTTFELLLCEETTIDEKADSLDLLNISNVNRQLWVDMLTQFQPTDEFRDRMVTWCETYTTRVEEGRAAITRARWLNALNSPSVMYGTNLLGLVLVTLAFGTLINQKSGRAKPWRQVNSSISAQKSVIRNTLLIVVLSVFDLACTVQANLNGGFQELNPFATQFINSPMLLTCFKLTTLAISTVILINLRRYRGSQFAAWWLCLICIVLTFRWTAYNSMAL